MASTPGKKNGTYTYDTLLKEIKQGIFHPVYFLYGNEEYFIDQIEKAILEHALTESEKAFNLSILYGKDSQVEHILDHAGQYPMMAERRVVIVREAQALKGLDKLLPYVQNPAETTVLVLCYKKEKADGRTKFGKTITKVAVTLQSKELRDYQVPKWLGQKLKELGYTISPEAAVLVSEHTGTKISNIMNELEKLFLNIPKGTQITPQHIKKYIGVSRQISVFELINAIMNANQSLAFRLLLQMEAQNSKGVLNAITSLLYRNFSQLLVTHQYSNQTDRVLAGKVGINPFFIKDLRRSATKYSAQAIKRIISLLLIYDAKAKGVDTWHMPDIELAKELTFKILQLAK